MKAFLAAWVTALVLVYAAAAFAQKEEIAENRTKWEGMAKSEKIRIIQVYRQWKALPEDQQEKMRHNFILYRRLSPEEQRLLKERYRIYQNLSPSLRDQVEERMRYIHSRFSRGYIADLEQQREMRKKKIEDRIKMLERSLFWKGLSEQEREVFRKMLTIR